MNRLIAADPKYCGAENLLSVSIDKDLDEAVGLAFLDGARDARHRTHADKGALSSLAHFDLRKTDMRQRRIDVQGAGGNPVAHAALCALEKIVRDDLKV